MEGNRKGSESRPKWVRVYIETGLENGYQKSTERETYSQALGKETPHYFEFSWRVQEVSVREEKRLPKKTSAGKPGRRKK